MMPIFGVVILTDLLMLALTSRELGGFDALSGFRETTCGWIIWYSVLHGTWLTWFALIVVSARKLEHGRVGLLWILFPALLCSTFVGVVLTSLDVFDRYWLRAVSHCLVEPVLLLVALWLLGRYSVRGIAKGRHIDVFSLYLRLSILNCSMKVLLTIRPDFTTIREISHGLYYVTFAAFIISYLLDKAMNSWVARL